MGLLDTEDKLKGLLSKFNVQGGGGSTGMGGRFGFNNVPITNNLNATFGASGYYVPQQGIGDINAYDAALQYQLGKQKQHELGIGVNGYGTQFPQYMLNYGYKF